MKQINDLQQFLFILRELLSQVILNKIPNSLYNYYQAKFIKVIQSRMGNSSPECNTCKKHTVCSKCKGCYNCNPIRNCKTCLTQCKENITSNIDFEKLKDIYENGKIEKIQAKASKISSSKLPLSNKQLHHLYLVLSIKVNNRQQNYEIAIEGVRREGLMEAIISTGCTSCAQFAQVTIKNKSFKELYEYIKTNLHEKTYHRYTNNCYHFGIKIITFLNPTVDYNQVLKSIHDYKDLQVQNFWQ